MSDQGHADPGLNRRRLLTVVAVAGAAPLASAGAATYGHSRDEPYQDNAESHPVLQDGEQFNFFSSAEQAFIKAAVARLIPKDDLGPGAIEAGVPIFIDRQLAGDFGKADDWYMQGPWSQGLPTQGYQSRMTPAQLYRAAIAAIDDAAHKQWSEPFAQLETGDQDGFLRQLEAGQVQLGGGVDAKSFFKILWQNVVEGFFADPVHGGNRGMVGWKLIGFAGARYDQRPYLKPYGAPYPLPPVAITGRPEWG